MSFQSRDNNFDHVEKAIEYIERHRKQHKDEWVMFSFTFKGKPVKIKSFNTWMQVFKVNGVDCSNAMEMRVKDYKEHLRKVLGGIK